VIIVFVFAFLEEIGVEHGCCCVLWTDLQFGLASLMPAYSNVRLNWQEWSSLACSRKTDLGGVLGCLQLRKGRILFMQKTKPACLEGWEE